ncbi:Trifunctional nucleotide phosphoesterase protein YfkN precursor [Planctomycetes bacterium Pla163]|uniref:Trifunctional nucleotide phosphoesterase protein YfkN n=1 Tax=Rohdeia mirabilis TaxID=2528008 RepID=A0A518CWN9_9BACT|nr:Trifunctional nucleotide phosphoesterase protein YfkN precursor [Planctomycetes bacterium Pla163]
MSGRITNLSNPSAARPVTNARGTLRRLASIAAVLLVCLWTQGLAASDAGASASEEPIHLILLHTNDVHGQTLPRRATWIEDREVWVGGLERAAAYIESVRRRADGPGEGVVLVDGGDWFQGTPEGRVREGREFVKLLKRLDYDAMALGNHEFDLGIEPLLALLLEAEMPSVCANLYESGERVGWVRPYRIVERCGLRIAFVGLISPSTPDITHVEARRLDFRDPIAEFTRVCDELPDDIDLVIPLTHNGLYLDRELAVARPDLPLVVGGHSHTYLRDGVVVGPTRIVQAGDKCTVVGRVDLLIDPATKRVLSSTSRLIELDRDPDPEFVDAELAAGVARLVERTDAAMSVEVGRLSETPVPPTPFASGGLGSWIADSMRTFARADVGLHNRGGIRSSLAKGPVTRRALFEVCPFGNTVVSFELTGAELEACLEQAIESRPEIRIEVSGVELDVRMVDDEEHPLRLVAVRVGGEPLDPKRTYRMATNSFLATGGDRVFRFDRELDLLDSGVLINELLEQQFAGTKSIALPTDSRFARVD